MKLQKEKKVLLPCVATNNMDGVWSLREVWVCSMFIGTGRRPFGQRRPSSYSVPYAQREAERVGGDFSLLDDVTLVETAKSQTSNGSISYSISCLKKDNAFLWQEGVTKIQCAVCVGHVHECAVAAKCTLLCVCVCVFRHAFKVSDSDRSKGAKIQKLINWVLFVLPRRMMSHNKK